ncbi:alpha/beta hydrolase family protein [Cohnella lubricantis]|uniref:Esterase family protein n=1 Tax=Cohnella lubricantis TaxID=2163172 RepID=A0A841TA84_9BACL|nr:alpha/beta hydrolase family protein [Cohnella lubricantis]MBB6676935.1 esterase family protein [Cohnella lubricantis]MBP2118339.1 S-formylglutathione hydrolase FrmB [Cohnella lubricantis]
MALIHCHFFSESLGISTSMTVILPQQTSGQIGMSGWSGGGKHPALYLLHGFSDDDTIWTRRTSIERYVAELGLAVVMPNVHKSFYADMAYGDRYWTFLSEELPAVARSFFPLSDKREDNFVAGLSMGGYGAFKWALRHPDRFAAAASLSGALDLAEHMAQAADTSMNRVFKLIFGDREIRGTEDDLLWLLEQSGKTEGLMPALFQSCGTEDFLYEDNVAFREKLASVGYPSAYVYEEHPGAHTWEYWDEHIQRALRFFMEQRDG